MFCFSESRRVTLCVAGVLLCTGSYLRAQDRQPPASATDVDRGVDPCVNFYAYACGSWLQKRSIPEDQERIMVFTDLTARNEQLLQQQLETAAVAPGTPIRRKYGNFYRACTETGRMDSEGLRPLRTTLDAIAHLRSIAGIGGLLGKPALLANGLFSLTVERDREHPEHWVPVVKPAPLTLPAAQDYAAQSSSAEAHRLALRSYLFKTFLSLGDSEPVARQEVAKVLIVERALASGELSPSDARDPRQTYHPVSLARLRQSARDFAWSQYLLPLHIPTSSPINVAQPGYVQAAENALRTIPLSAWRSYLRVHSVTPVAPYLRSDFRNAAFQFFQADLRGVTAMEPRAQSCTRLSDQQLGDAVGQDWLKQNFPEKRTQLAIDILNHLRDAFKTELNNQSWLSASAMQEAQRKLSAMTFYVAAPDHWRDYSGLDLGRNSFVDQLRAVQVFNRDENFKRIRSGSQDHRWYWTVPSADANYDETENNIEIPAGLLQPPFLSERVSLAANYGAFGMLAGHELTHGFDDSGAQYDERGKLQSWFTLQDKAGFEQMSSCEVAEYGRFEALPGVPLDSRFELGEMTADNGGLRIAHDAFVEASKERDAMSTQAVSQKDEQDFFVAFAQIWCEKRRPEYQRVRGQTDPHPPGEFRVNGAVQNLDAFGAAFACRRGQPMMPVKSCHVW